MKTFIVVCTAFATLAILLLSGSAFAALDLEGQNGIFLNSLAYPIAASKVEVSSHYVALNSLGEVATYNFSTGLKGNVEVGFTRIASSVTGVKSQNVFQGKWQFGAESTSIPALSVWVQERSLVGGSSSPDFGLSATKVLTASKHTVVLDLGARYTKAQGLGLFGFADNRQLRLEGSAALFVTKKLALATEFKQQVDARAWTDVAVRYVANNELNLDFGIANLNSALDNQVAFAATWSR